jgi:hypothetical protein
MQCDVHNLFASGFYMMFCRTNRGVYAIWWPINCTSSVKLLVLSLQGNLHALYFFCELLHCTVWIGAMTNWYGLDVQKQYWFCVCLFAIGLIWYPHTFAFFVITKLKCVLQQQGKLQNSAEYWAPNSQSNIFFLVSRCICVHVLFEFLLLVSDGLIFSMFVLVGIIIRFISACSFSFGFSYYGNDPCIGKGVSCYCKENIFLCWTAVP